jgi:hypothetical protein
VSWRPLLQAVAFDPDSSGTLAQLPATGQRSPAKLIDRYKLACRLDAAHPGQHLKSAHRQSQRATQTNVPHKGT